MVERDFLDRNPEEGLNREEKSEFEGGKVFPWFQAVSHEDLVREITGNPEASMRILR
ncbi:hypothetical protein [Thermosulfurimonas sp. F29]|uniref:hypothetical protein n=1 Tax=Thermosulfurimonas sp. F29 TaxID=2867247 RepID=UPI001C830F46|nr:hypothetical protein [Thermosulfurimonas sp. F29]MBX6422413.1 hypothetical protein [Thermosulfurimonas sp. F29]